MVEDRRRINEEILAPNVRVIDDKSEQLGILSLRDALNAARERELDLVEVAPNADPPVCRILDYGKYQYMQVKRQREAKKAQKITEIKEIRLRPKTDDYHTGFKVKRARDFLTQGMKVKVRIQFRGREITHPEIGLEQLREVAADLSDVATVEQRPDMEGRTMLMVLAPIPSAIIHRTATEAAKPGGKGAEDEHEDLDPEIMDLVMDDDDDDEDLDDETDAEADAQDGPPDTVQPDTVQADLPPEPEPAAEPESQPKTPAEAPAKKAPAKAKAPLKAAAAATAVSPDDDPPDSVQADLPPDPTGPAES